MNLKIKRQKQNINKRTIIRNKTIRFKVLKSDAQWFGVTYSEDKEKAVNAINSLIKSNIYPSNLW